MIRKSKFRRYQNLISSIKNWEKYLLNKVYPTDPITYTTRKERFTFTVPSNLGGIFKEIFLDEFYDLLRIENVTDGSSVLFDVGANAGYFTIFMAEKINPKEIHCFEPFPNNFKLLESNIQPMNKSRRNVFLNNMAVVGSGIDSVNLFFNDNCSFSPTASILKGIDTINNEIQVRATNLEKYCNENSIDKIDMLKMDCEGAEYDIFYNMSATFFSKINSIYMEIHDLDLERNNIKELVSYFGQVGYTTFVMPINDNTAMVWAQRTKSF